MSTRSYILIENTDGTFSGVYCRFDGYPKGVGATLLDSYRTEAKIRNLIARGTLSSLRSSPETSVVHHSDEKDAAPEILQSITSGRYAGIQYRYVFTRDGRWMVYDDYQETYECLAGTF
ncbi:MAG: hypothetical protein PHY67_04195 [Methanocorpusculum sp.]|jgi:hypothetical protein|nr:hypothetical protein [Methanocorpusculum sp.]